MTKSEEREAKRIRDERDALRNRGKALLDALQHLDVTTDTPGFDQVEKAMNEFGKIVG